MLANLGNGIPMDKVERVANPELLCRLQKEALEVQVSPNVTAYMVSITQATRSHPQLKLGASPRGSRALYRASKAWAAMAGRDFVTPEDIHAVAYDVLRHRIILSFEAQAEELSSDDVISALLKAVPLP